MGKTILILGGGTAGVAAANVLADVLPPGNDLVVVDRSPVHLFFASLPLLLVGAASLASSPGFPGWKAGVLSLSKPKWKAWI